MLVDPDGMASKGWPWLSKLFGKNKEKCPSPSGSSKSKRRNLRSWQSRKTFKQRAKSFRENTNKVMKAIGSFIYSEKEINETHWENVDFMTREFGPFRPLSENTRYRVVFKGGGGAGRFYLWTDKMKRFKAFSSIGSKQIAMIRKGSKDWHVNFDNPDAGSFQLQEFVTYSAIGIQIFGITVWIKDKSEIQRSNVTPQNVRKLKKNRLRINLLRKHWRRYNQ